MANRLTINHTGDQIQLLWQRGNSVARTTEPVNFSHPFNAEVLAEIRWYLEEYLHFPYGIEPNKASSLEQKLQGWGEELFNLVFCSNEKGRQFFQEATRDGLRQCELGISSEDPQLLNLPWELLYCSDYQFLAPSLAGIYRSLESFAVRAEMKPLSQDRLNILLVIARPYGERDVSFQTIARPLLESLKPISNRVNLKVLRPPSFEQLERELNANKGFYHIVHFDGHGDFDPNSVGFQHSFGEVGQGVLVFENADGSPQIVTAQQIAQSLTDCQVPLFVLNACRSAQEGNGSFSSVATRLVSLGAKSVVAMSYNVYVVAAKHFIGRLYEQLAMGSSVQVAVAAGRRELLNKPMRYSPKGDLRLQDWMVPILYQQEDHRPFIPTSEEIPDLDTFLGETDAISLIDFPDEGQFGFLGRDYDTLRLERAFRDHNFVLLRGLAGVGKTELACGFGRWFVQTKGVQAAYFASFEQGRGISQVIYQVGRSVWGDKFSQLSDDQQESAVIKYLKQTSCLLIWDNFESVAGFSDGNDGLCSPEEQQALTRFLKALRGSKSFILITSRREEKWLDINYQLLEISGLVRPDAEVLGNKILDTAGVNRQQLPPEYLELFDLLGGHPLSLRVVLPHLKTQSPNQLIDALRRGLDTFVGESEEGRDKSLIVSLDYSFNCLSEKARRHLPFLGLFCERVHVVTLTWFVEKPENKQLYQSVFGETLQVSESVEIINEATKVGLIELLGDNLYKLHPTLPWYLRRQLSKLSVKVLDETDLISNTKLLEVLQQSILNFYADLANYYRQDLIEKPKTAMYVLHMEEPNLLQYLRDAEQKQQWAEAQSILQALGEIYKLSSRLSEFRVLRQRILKQLGKDLEQAKTKGKDAFDFWIYLQGLDAREALIQGNLQRAREICEINLDELSNLNDPEQKASIGTLYHNLGIISKEERCYKEAITYLHKALPIFKNIQNWHNLANVYSELGSIAEKQEDYKKAKFYLQKALKICNDTQNLYLAGTVYHQLGILAQQQEFYEEAEIYFQEALKICQNFQDRENAATEYYHLGIVAFKQNIYTKATDYCREAMKIYEDIQDDYKVANVYHLMGNIAFGDANNEEAKAYYVKAIPIFQKANDCYKLVGIFLMLGNTLVRQENYPEALRIYCEGFILSLQHCQDSIEDYIDKFKIVLEEIGESQFSTIWKEVTGSEFEGEIRDMIMKDD